MNHLEATIILHTDHYHPSDPIETASLSRRKATGKIVPEKKAFYDEAGEKAFELTLGTHYIILYTANLPSYEYGQVKQASGFVRENEVNCVLSRACITYEDNSSKTNGQFHVSFVPGLKIIDKQTDQIVFEIPTSAQ